MSQNSTTKKILDDNDNDDNNPEGLCVYKKKISKFGTRKSKMNEFKRMAIFRWIDLCVCMGKMSAKRRAQKLLNVNTRKKNNEKYHFSI